MSKAFSRYLSVIALLLLVGAIINTEVQPTSAQSTLQFTPLYSTYVSSADPTGNHTAAQSLLAGRDGNGTTYYTFMKFNITAITRGARIESANLILTSIQSSGIGRIGTFLAANNSWTNNTMGWATAPIASIFTNPSDIQSINSTAGHAYTMDVTRDVQIASMSGTLTEVMGPENSTSVAFGEFYRLGNHAPVLKVRYGVYNGIFYSYAGITVSGLPSTMSTRVVVDGVEAAVIPGRGVTAIELANSTTTHKVQVEQIKLAGENTRYFAHENVMEIGQPGIYNFTYKTQYFLMVSSDYGTVTGTGWYDAWSFANYEVLPPSVPVPGPFGYLGAKEDFDGWSGDSFASIPSASIAMDRPHTIVAVWKADYTVFYLVMATIVGVVSGSSAFFIVKRKKTAKKDLEEEKEPEIIVPACPHCGKRLELVQNTPYVFCADCKKLYDTKKITVEVPQS